MKKVLFTTLSIIAVAAMMLVSCKKDNGTDNGKDNGKDNKPVEEYAGPVVGTENWAIIGTILGTSWDTDYKAAAVEENIFVVKNVKLEAANEFKWRDTSSGNGGWDVNRGGDFVALGEAFDVEANGHNIKPELDGIYDIYLNLAVDQAAVVAKDGAQPAWKEPAAGPSREGKALKLTPEISENYLFNYTGKDSRNRVQFNTEGAVDLGAGSTFQVKFFANTWKEDGNPDRLCAFETGDENPCMLIRFSNDGTQPGQLRFVNGRWSVGGNDGVKLTDKDGNPYIFAAQKWHVLTMVVTRGEGNALTVDFYDNETLINSATGTYSTTDLFYLQRFEFGMSWDDGSWDNTGYSTSQLFDGYIDYARVWTRSLAASEIAESLCDVDVETAEGLLTYWIMGEGEAEGIIPNKAGDKAFDINFANMYEMNGNVLRKNLDLKNSFINALEETDTPLCEF